MSVWRTEKRAAHGPRGMVACQHWRAAEAGAAALAAGGNAVDAAVTAALTLSVVEPWLSGLGGGGFMVRMDRDGAAQVLDFNVASGSRVDPADYPPAGGRDGDWFDWPAVVDDRNLRGWTSVCVPGAVAGLAEALERFGSLTFAEALAPAIAEAEHGLRVDWYTALCLAIDAPNLARCPDAAALFLEDGRAPALPEGTAEIARPWPAKAALLKRLAEAGPRDFYEGESAALLLADLAEGGAPIEAADLAAYRPAWRAPLGARYRDLDLALVPGASGGPALADALGRMTTSIVPGGAADGAHMAACADAIRAAYEVRLRTQPHGGQSCTTHISAVDADGTFVSLTNTLLSRFGAKVVSGRTGLPLNNGMMWFDPRPGTPNAIAPGTRPLANMCPLVAARDGTPVLALGAAGGRQIFPAIAQILSYLADVGMDLETAFHAPRIDASSPLVAVPDTAPADAAGRIARSHKVAVVADTLYPVRFSVPSAVMRAEGGSVGMAHPNHPWSAAVAEPAR
ncbi:gamma-glutamyltransferase [Roseivivax isoporae]|uniref:Gamma-glutamyltransferase n=1 Tax=Roseivivax isoporae LMG 25204 TaxID=1449351 RepID=X7FAE8_9RHOB|nr:gamma-glutamyltransferase [Roseivivax isoporae]ETX29897.1 gamma-glutamyltransferase [Roseivivax isoporae LMG 25204]